MRWLLTSLLLVLLFSSVREVYSAAPPGMNVYPSGLPAGGEIWPGASRSGYIIIQETGGSEALTSVSLSVTGGNAASWVRLSPTFIPGIEAGQSSRVTATITLPQDAAYGAYSCVVSVSASNHPSVSIQITFAVPVILSLAVDNPQVSITTEQTQTLNLTLRNVCSTASISDIQLSADSDVNRWLDLRSSPNFLGNADLKIAAIPVRVPPGESKPIGKYSGKIFARYLYGPPFPVESSPVLVKVLPPDRWFKDKSLQIELLPPSAGIYPTPQSSKKEEELTTTKQALKTIMDLIKEDPSGFYDSTEPFLIRGTELCNKLATDLVKAYDGYLNKTLLLSKVMELVQSLRKVTGLLRNDMSQENRPEYKNSMLTVDGRLDSILGTWEKKVGAEQKSTEERAQAEEQQGTSDLKQAQDAQFLYPSYDYYNSAKTHFDQARTLYLQIGSGLKARDCEDRAAKCEAGARSKKEEIDKTLSGAQNESRAGDDSYDKAQKTYTLIARSNLFETARNHYTVAAREYRKFGTTEHNSQAKQCDDRAKSSGDKKEETDRQVAETSEAATRRLAEAENAVKQGQKSFFPPSSLSNYGAAKVFFLEAQSLYNKLGADANLRQAQNIELRMQEMESKVRAERIKLGVYIFIILVLLTLAGLRYVRMLSTQRKIDTEKSLFQKQP